MLVNRRECVRVFLFVCAFFFLSFSFIFSVCIFTVSGYVSINSKKQTINVLMNWIKHLANVTVSWNIQIKLAFVRVAAIYGHKKIESQGDIE